MDKECSVFEQFANVVKFQGERYEVSLPWKDPAVAMPDNYQLYLKRLYVTLQCHYQKLELFEQYHQVIEQQLNIGIIEPLNISESDSENVHYIHIT